MTGLENLTRDYRAAFLRYLPRRDEAALRTGYEVGRFAVEAGISILELARMHHDVFLEVLLDSTTKEELSRVAASASDFFLEVLATYDMTQRAFLEKS